MCCEPEGTEGRLWVGTSGWTYRHWRTVFYPEGVKSADYLGFYSTRFRTTEVNYSFYHVPKPETYRKWAAQVPESFVFSVKVNRAMTHVQRFKEVDDLWRDFLEGALELGPKMGVFLLQFPPSFRIRLDLLAAFLRWNRELCKARPVRLAFEFRHASWFTAEVCALLRQFDAAMVIASSSRYPQAPVEPTASLVYLRFHGPAQLFSSSYSDEELRPWAKLIREWLREGLDVYAYFNNDAAGAAVSDASRLLEMVERTAVRFRPDAAEQEA